MLRVSVHLAAEQVIRQEMSRPFAAKVIGHSDAGKICRRREWSRRLLLGAADRRRCHCGCDVLPATPFRDRGPWPALDLAEFAHDWLASARLTCAQPLRNRLEEAGKQQF